MNEPIRTERTHGIGQRLDASQRASLLQVRYTPGYEILLDLIEQICIEQETRLINQEARDEEGIVAEHRMAKAFWQVFVTLQTKVEVEIAIHLGLEADAKRQAEEEASYDPDQEILKA